MDIIITSILNIVSALCSCSANNRCCYLLDLQENKEDLNNALVELRATRDGVKIRVDEAENNPNQERTPEVDNWLQGVQTIDDEVVKVIQKADQEIQGRCFGGNCPINCWNACKIGKLVLRKLLIVNDLKSKGNLFPDVAYRLPPPLVQREPVDLTVGMESMFEKAWRSLAEDEVKIIGLYGLGGVGKTTLLKQINNAFLQSTTTSSSRIHGFDVVILVVVSKVINIDAIQKEIGNRLGLSSPDRISIFNVLIKRNFLLLLDDIWEIVDLQSIGVPRLENSKSKVIFTTRFETVCEHMEAKMLKIQCLPWHGAWSLFQEKVGERALNSFPRARELAKDVARECCGLPLALITIGRAMSSKKTVQEWRHAITTLQKSASEFPGMGDKVLPLLKLSYDYLRTDMIKSCFLYCALFPEDHSIDKAKLIDYWIGEGVILLNEFDHIDEARNHGYDVIGNLNGACLLESGGNEETEVKMHDTIRDLALWIAHECGNKRDKMFITDMFYLTRDNRDSRESSSWYNADPERSWYNAERIYLRNTDPRIKLRLPPKSPILVTLIIKSPLSMSSYSEFKLPQNFFQFMPLLRVLDLSCSRMLTFPMCITDLVELQYLSLSRTRIKVLPEELGKLVKLNLLDLSYMWNLMTIPPGVIGNLVELRVLNFYGSYEVDWDLDEGYRLKHLNDFGITINAHHINNLTKLLSSSNKNLQMCTRHLDISKRNPLLLWVVFDSQSEDVKPQSKSTSSSSPIITLEKLQLLFNLETLSLRFLEADDQLMNMVGIEQQQHLGRSSSFQNLSKIEIIGCNGFKDLTWVGYVPNLQILDVHSCKELEEIVVRVVVDGLGGSTGDEIISSSKKNKNKNKNKMMNNIQDEEVFKCLKTLIMYGLPKLKSICRNALAFPCLETMVVRRCPELKKLPLDYGSNVNNTLREIEGEPKWWNELRWEEEEDHDNNELLKSKFLPYFNKKSV